MIDLGLKYKDLLQYNRFYRGWRD